MDTKTKELILRLKRGWSIELRELAVAELERLSSDLEAASKDAQRYRWLREQPNDMTAPRIDVVRWTEADEAYNEGEGLRMEALDASIDAAMNPTKENKKS